MLTKQTEAWLGTTLLLGMIVNVGGDGTDVHIPFKSLDGKMCNSGIISMLVASAKLVLPFWPFLTVVENGKR